MKRNERGQAYPLVAFLMLAMAGIAIVLGYVNQAVLEQSAAQTAADAAALAGAQDGRLAADHAATANHGRVIYFQVSGSDTIVRAQVGSTTKTARARRDGLF